MAQAQMHHHHNHLHHLPEKEESAMMLQEQSFCFDKDSASFRFNVDAPEFVPRPPQTPVPVSGYFVPFPFMGSGANGGDWIFLGEQDAVSLVSESKSTSTGNNQQPKTPVLTEELQRKILKQMEYQFSDMSLLANDNLAKQISKDPEGYVPIANVSSTKKIKSLVGNNYALLAQALKASTKLDVCSDMKRVKRKVPFTDKVKEELQLRTIVAENLPDDHSHQNIEKIFNVAGSVKTIRICHPQDPNNRSKGDFIISTKLHALVEFENSEPAERAAEKLNDQKNWRKGLRVRCLLRRSPKSVLKTAKPIFDSIFDDCESPPESSGSPEALSPLVGLDLATEINGMDLSWGSSKTWGKGRTSKPRHRHTNSHSGRGLLSLSPQRSFNLGESSTFTRQTVKGPKMPDGTRGFTMGRGRPLTSSSPPPPVVSRARRIVV